MAVVSAGSIPSPVLPVSPLLKGKAFVGSGGRGVRGYFAARVERRIAHKDRNVKMTALCVFPLEGMFSIWE
jgi:hypothetical protein